ncbi:MAG TPA: protease pro-enzyme activation domain-containing protein, partial [Trebonia sp.]
MRILRFRRTLLACLLAVGSTLGALALASPSVAAPDTAAATRPTALTGNAAPALPAGSTRIGTLPAGQRLTVEVTLGLRNQATLAALENGLADTNSPYYHDFLTPAQFDAAFAPTDAEVAQVDNALRSAGLTPGPAAADHLSIPVTATAAQLEKAFGVTLSTYREPGGRVVYANATTPQVAGNVAGIVQGIVGLDDLDGQQSLAVHASRTATTASKIRALKQATAARPALANAGPVACSAAENFPDGLPVNLVGDLYGFGQLWNQNDLGGGQRIAVVEFAPAPKSDINAFKRCYGISDTINYIPVDGGASASAAADSDEVALDVELLAALAPKATIDVYQAPNTETGYLAMLKRFVSPPKGIPLDNTLTTSWGGCEAYGAINTAFGKYLSSQETYYQQANAQGQTFLAASGDTGSTGCLGSNYPASLHSVPSVVFPSSSPYVTSVGGTSFLTNSADTEIFQAVYNESGKGEGATGGGPSISWCMLPYQYKPSVPGLTTAQYTKSGCPASTGHLLRRTPDVSADADPQSGYGIYYGGQWVGIAGTSAAAPLWAAYAAMTDASPYCRTFHQAGALPQVLYSVAASKSSAIYSTGNTIFYDVAPVVGWQNNNNYTPSGYTGGLYPVTHGYDLTTGLGTPEIWGSNPSRTAITYPVLACQQVTVFNVYGNAGPANTSGIEVLIYGAGFSKTRTQDKVRVYQGSKVLTTLTPVANPRTPDSFTILTVKLPRESARTVDLRVSVNGSAYSAAVAADRFTYANAPHINSISPARGSHNGGTKITIHGSN